MIFFFFAATCLAFATIITVCCLKNIRLILRRHAMPRCWRTLMPLMTRYITLVADYFDAALICRRHAAMPPAAMPPLTPTLLVAAITLMPLFSPLMLSSDAADITPRHAMPLLMIFSPYIRHLLRCRCRQHALMLMLSPLL